MRALVGLRQAALEALHELLLCRQPKQGLQTGRVLPAVTKTGVIPSAPVLACTHMLLKDNFCT